MFVFVFVQESLDNASVKASGGLDPRGGSPILILSNSPAKSGLKTRPHLPNDDP